MMADDEPKQAGDTILGSAPGYDDVTGFPLRRLFLDQVDEGIRNASKPELKRLWLGVAGLPTLRHLNVAYGYDAVDTLIGEVAGILRKELPEAFALGRLEGGELAVASFGPPRRVSRRTNMDEQIRFLGDTFQMLGVPIFTSVRVGICRYQHPDDATVLLRKAQMALIKARDSHESDLQFYNDDLGKQAEQRAHMVRGLVQAVEHDALMLYYQPQVDLRSGDLIGAEALLRWPQAGGRFISPGDFIPVAERSELIVPLGEWVLRRACEQAAQWQNAGLLPFRVAVNVSPVQFQKTNLVDKVHTLLDDLKLEPEWLELEVTEGAVMCEGQASESVLHKLRDMGVELAIDDFGTGYSSLSYLKHLPVQRLKIDQSFVRDCDHNADDAAITRSIIAIGKNLGMKVLAEGVENKKHVEFLTAEACDEAQGYYYSRPLNPEAFTEYALRRDLHSMPV